MFEKVPNMSLVLADDKLKARELVSTFSLRDGLTLMLQLRVNTVCIRYTKFKYRFLIYKCTVYILNIYTIYLQKSKNHTITK